MTQELFLENGHLSDAGLAALRDSQLDELARLEAAEHLSFCDACLDRYLALAEPVQIQPPEDLTLPVMRRIRQRIARVLMNRYAVAAAAVVLAFGLWGSGVFGRIAQKPDWQERPDEQTHWEISDSLNKMFGVFGSAADHLLDALQPSFDQPSGEAGAPADSVKGE